MAEALQTPSRHFHVDKILEQPGPSTDPSFDAGAGVSSRRLPVHGGQEAG